MKKKFNLEKTIMVAWQTILVWTYSLKREGKREDGVYNTDGLRLWNPFSWLIILLIFFLGLIVSVIGYIYEFIKDFNKNF